MRRTRGNPPRTSALRQTRNCGVSTDKTRRSQDRWRQRLKRSQSLRREEVLQRRRGLHTRSLLLEILLILDRSKLTLDGLTLLLGQHTQLTTETKFARKENRLLLLDLLQLSLELSALKLHLLPLRLREMEIAMATLLKAPTAKCGL